MLGPNPAGVLQLQEIMQRIIGLGAGFAFIFLTIYLIWGGIKYITSGGDQKKLGQAHQTMTWALLGILFLAIIWTILLLIESFTGVKITNVCIGLPGAQTNCP